MNNSSDYPQGKGGANKNFRGSKQSTLDILAYHFDIQKSKGKDKPKKTIIINGIEHAAKENYLDLKIGFSLLPSKTSFSKIIVDLYFQDNLLNSTSLSIPESLLLNDSFEHSLVLDMSGIREGDYVIRAELYELWETAEKLNFTSDEIIVHYTPITREERLVKIPTVKSVAGTDLVIVSSSTKKILSDIEQDLKKESDSKKDYW
jgi:hypothetical protein